MTELIAQIMKTLGLDFEDVLDAMGEEVRLLILSNLVDHLAQVCERQAEELEGRDACS